MDTYEAELREKWNRITYHDGGSLQLAITHPLDWFVRYATQYHKSLVIVSEEPAKKVQSSKSIDAACNIRKDGRYAISFTLLDRTQEDVFITMSNDIIVFSQHENGPKEALKKVLLRYAAWMKLLGRKSSVMLGDNAQKGLIAELLFLKENIEKGLNPSDAVAGWVGPEGADQDFVYNDGWHEIKATGISSSSVTISSIEQLSSDTSGELVVFRIDKCAPAQVGAVTLYKVVHAIIDMIKAEVGVVEAFILKLGSAGYIDMIDYDQQYFSIALKTSYDVNEEFPRLSRSAIPAEVLNVEYQLDLPSISLWKK